MVPDLGRSERGGLVQQLGAQAGRHRSDGRAISVRRRQNVQCSVQRSLSAPGAGDAARSRVAELGGCGSEPDEQPDGACLRRRQHRRPDRLALRRRLIPPGKLRGDAEGAARRAGQQGAHRGPPVPALQCHPSVGLGRPARAPERDGPGGKGGI
eukprot:scaffold24762_cov107-Isochrysis_galbana.AAC.1